MNTGNSEVIPQSTLFESSKKRFMRNYPRNGKTSQYKRLMKNSS
jgi:hypothetical protein